MKRSHLKTCAIIMFLIFIAISTIGCGETFSGVGKDFRRVGKGVKTVFVREMGDE